MQCNVAILKYFQILNVVMVNQLSSCINLGVSKIWSNSISDQICELIPKLFVEQPELH